jgi:hypothetical protein
VKRKLETKGQREEYELPHTLANFQEQMELEERVIGHLEPRIHEMVHVICREEKRTRIEEFEQQKECSPLLEPVGESARDCNSQVDDPDGEEEAV